MASRRFRASLSVLGLGLLLLSTCPRVPALPALPLPTAIAGCEGIGRRPGPTCLRRAESKIRLVLWLPGQRGEPTLRRDGRALPPEGYTLAPSPAGLAVVVHDTAPGELRVDLGRRSATWTVEHLSPAYAQLHGKTALTPAQREAKAALTPRERLILDCHGKVLSRSQLSPSALAELALRSAWLDERRCVPKAVGVSFMRQLYASASLEQTDASLSLLGRHEPTDLNAQLDRLYYEGQVQQRRGFPAQALERFERASSLSAATRQDQVLAMSVTQEARVLAHFGRFDEAQARSEAALAVEALAPDLRSDLELELGWIAVVRRRLDPAAPDPVPLARAAVSGLLAAKRHRPQTLAIATLNLAAAEALVGDHQWALRHLEAVELPALTARQRLYWELTHARIALTRGQLDAAHEHLNAAEFFDDDPEQAEFRPELLEARAELQRRSGRPRAALASYAAAEDLARDLARRVPMHLGRVQLWTVQTQARSEHVALALELGERERALCTVLSARALHLQALTQGFGEPSQDPERRRRFAASMRDYHSKRDALLELEGDTWRKSEAELAALAPERARLQRARDEALTRALAELEASAPVWRCARARPQTPSEALLVAYPDLGAPRGWWLLLDRPGAVIEVAHVEGSEAPEAAREALGQLRARGALDGLDGLVVVPIGAMLPVDFHALVPTVPVRYSLAIDLDLELAAPKAPRAAVLGPGRSNLSEVDPELDLVHARLEQLGLEPEQAWDPRAEDQPWLLHYAGHGTHEGLGGWASALALDSGPLDSQAILLGRQAPALVVLSACSTAATDPSMLDGGMNLAVALLLAGSRLVIAADAPVNDRQAREFSTALYTQLAADAKAQPLPTPEALTRALTKVQRANPTFADWRAWTR